MVRLDCEVCKRYWDNNGRSLYQKYKFLVNNSHIAEAHGLDDPHPHLIAVAAESSSSQPQSDRYEFYMNQLLALVEGIGDDSTGLTEESIMKNMKRHKFVCVTTKCCVCQEDFLAGDSIGKLDCGHDFHAECIKQWLMLKNLCPFCKTTGLAT